MKKKTLEIFQETSRDRAGGRGGGGFSTTDSARTRVAHLRYDHDNNGNDNDDVHRDYSTGRTCGQRAARLLYLPPALRMPSAAGKAVAGP